MTKRDGAIVCIRDLDAIMREDAERLARSNRQSAVLAGYGGELRSDSGGAAEASSSGSSSSSSGSSSNSSSSSSSSSSSGSSSNVLAYYTPPPGNRAQQVPPAIRRTVSTPAYNPYPNQAPLEEKAEREEKSGYQEAKRSESVQGPEPEPVEEPPAYAPVDPLAEPLRASMRLRSGAHSAARARVRTPRTPNNHRNTAPDWQALDRTMFHHPAGKITLVPTGGWGVDTTRLATRNAIYIIVGGGSVLHHPECGQLRTSEGSYRSTVELAPPCYAYDSTYRMRLPHPLGCCYSLWQQQNEPEEQDEEAKMQDDG